MIAEVRTPSDIEVGLTQAIHLSRFLQDSQDGDRADGPILEGIQNILMSVYAVWEDVYSPCEGNGLQRALHESSVGFDDDCEPLSDDEPDDGSDRGGI